MKWLRQELQELPSFEYLLEHIETIESTIESNPTNCFETCKALIESLCKTILNNKGIPFNTDISFQGLVRQTIQNTMSVENGFESDIAELGRRLASVAQQLSEIRNRDGFSSHGHDALSPKITANLSFLAFRVSDTIGGFILRCYKQSKQQTRDTRIHYKDCQDFNEYFDDLNPLPNEVNISISEALYNQDYESYREEYFAFIEQQKQELEELS